VDVQGALAVIRVGVGVRKKCAPETVKKHLQAAFLKLAVPSRAKLIALAREER